MSHDAIIVGGGPAGSTTALSLARKGWRVAVIEKAAFPRRKVCGEFMSATSIAVVDALGLGDEWRAQAGPEIRRVALYSGKTLVHAPMPTLRSGGFGRALGRDVLDAMLIERARDQGVAVVQPAKAVAIRRDGDLHQVELTVNGRREVLAAPVVVAAHGSWEQGPLPTHLAKINNPADFLGFKAHFRRAKLPSDLMPLLFFPGGYGGMVWADEGRLSLSCCIRRDTLERLRRQNGCSASEAVERHVIASCLGVRQALDDAERDGAWLAAGPIRPGIRQGYRDDLFRVGNLAGESHPVIAEGISMAIQSGWLLADALIQTDPRSRSGRVAAAKVYQAAWRAQFARRINVATILAGVAVRPGAAQLAGAFARRVPSILTIGAALSGKNTVLPAAT